MATRRQLTLFFAIWAVVVFYDRAVRGTTDTVWSVLIVLAAGLLVLRPRSVARVGLLSAVHLTWYLVGYAARADVHWHIAAMMHLTFLVAIGWAWLKERRFPTIEALAPAIAPVARWVFCVEVFSAGFAKLNAGFTDPAISCAVSLMDIQRTAFPFSLLPDAGWVGWMAILGTILSETGAPVLLAFRTTRPLGYLVTIGFFFFIGTNPVGYLYEFAGEFLAMSVFFVGPELVSAGIDALQPLVRAAAPLWADRRWWARSVVLLVLGALAFGSGDLDFREERLYLCRVVYVVGLGFLSAVLALGWRRVEGGGPSLAVFPSPRALMVVPLIFLVGEGATYIGLKHVPTMTMAGNHAVSTAYSNHLIVDPVPRWEFNRVVRIERSSNKSLTPGKEMVWLAFSDWMARHPGATVDWEVDGAPGHADGVKGARQDGRFERSIWPALLRLDSQVFPRKSPGCGHGAKHAPTG